LDIFITFFSEDIFYVPTSPDLNDKFHVRIFPAFTIPFEKR
jgi:hypothetical protein